MNTYFFIDKYSDLVVEVLEDVEKSYACLNFPDGTKIEFQGEAFLRGLSTGAISKKLANEFIFLEGNQ